MLVTAIEQQKKDPSRYSVFIDGVFSFGLILADIQYFKIEEGKEISQETYDYIMDTIVYIKAQEVALRYIGYQMRIGYEVERKLKQEDFSEEIVARVMEFCTKYHYIDDLAYAKAYIKQRQRLNPKGKYVLQGELKQKGVKDSLIQIALEEAEEMDILNEAEAAYHILTKKVRNLDNIDEKQKKRLWGFLQRRGYSYDIIKEAWQKLWEEN